MWRKECRIGNFALERVVGYGELGIVYRARNRATDETVAVKVLRPHIAGNTKAEELFLRGPIIASQIRHDRVVGIREMGTSGGRLYYAMEYVDGLPLQHALHRDGMPLARRMRILNVIARAVHHLHGRGVLHSDLKPSNILMTASGEPKITDFESAVLRAPETGPDGALGEGILCGTPPYMPPEALRGTKAVFDPRRDVYALGVMAYRMATGVLPYVAPDLIALMRLKEMEPPPMALWNVTVEARLESTIRRAIMPAPVDRWGSAMEFAKAVEGYLKGAKLDESAPAAKAAAAVKKHRLLSLAHLRRTIDKAACL
jgi:serine/threonine protein kinase